MSASNARGPQGEGDRTASTPRWALAALGLVIAAGCWPWLWMLRLWPASRDASIWIANGAWSHADWFEWVFATRQFQVGYRPVTGLSYTLNWLVGGWSAWPYRVTDLALHAVSATLIFVLFRRLQASGMGPGAAPPHAVSQAAVSRTAWGALLAAAVFAFHPLADQVVPHLARRAYSLATALGLAGLVVALGPGDGRPSAARRVAGGVLLALALASNETAIVHAAVLPGLIWAAHGASPGGAVRRTVPAWVPVGLALAVRTLVAGGVGGYASEADRVERVLPIVAATWRALAARLPEPGASIAPATWLGGIGAAIVFGYYVVRIALGARASVGPGASAASSASRGAMGAGRAGVVLAVWLALFTALFAPLGVWFPRQAYVVLAPFALLVGWVAASTPGRNLMGTLLHALPQAILIGSIALASPVFRGPDLSRVAGWRATDRVMRDLHRAALALDGVGRSTVGFVIPFHTRPGVWALRARERSRVAPLPARQAEVWMDALLRGTSVETRRLFLFERDPLGDGPTPRFVPAGSGGELRLPPSGDYWPPVAGLVVSRPDGEWAVPVDRLRAAAGESTHVWFDDGRQGTFVFPASGVSPDRR